MSSELYPPLRKPFWEERSNNPRLMTARLPGYGIDAHFKEVKEKNWNKGIKFDKHMRETKVTLLDKSHEGPLKPEEYPKLYEKPQQYFGRTRRTRPARVSTAIPDRSLLREMRKREEDHYRIETTLKDPWSPQPVCGIIKQSPVFMLPESTRSPDRPVGRPLFPSLDKDKAECHSPNSTESLSISYGEFRRPETMQTHRGKLLLGVAATSRGRTPASIPSPGHTLSRPDIRTGSLEGLMVRTDTAGSIGEYFEGPLSPPAPPVMNESQWQPAVSHSKSSMRRRHEENIRLVADQHKIYTTGYDRVITLKTAENLAVSLPSRSRERSRSLVKHEQRGLASARSLQLLTQLADYNLQDDKQEEYRQGSA